MAYGGSRNGFIVTYVRDDEVSVVQGGAIDLNQNLVVAELWNRVLLVVLEFLKAVLAAIDDPGLGSLWNLHHVGLFMI